MEGECKELSVFVPYDDIEKMGRAIAQSKLFGMQTPEQAIALMLIAQAEGLHPAIAARDYHIIQGRPALKADAMLARFQLAGGKVQWKEISDSRVSAVFSHPSGGSVEMEWTMDRAKKAGITEKDNWKKYPRQMLRARVISEGIRTVFPGSVVGVYTPEEVQDMEPLKVEPLNITPEKEAPQDDKKKLSEWHTKLLELLSSTYDDIETRKEALIELTTWTDKNGKEHEGKASLYDISEKMAQVAFGKLKKKLEEATDGQD